MNDIRCGYLLLIWIFLQIQIVYGNRPPRFLIDGQTEIVLRLKEGNETPAGKYFCNITNNTSWRNAAHINYLYE